MEGNGESSPLFWSKNVNEQIKSFLNDLDEIEAKIKKMKETMKEMLSKYDAESDIRRELAPRYIIPCSEHSFTPNK
jgi:hypothetical protein